MFRRDAVLSSWIHAIGFEQGRCLPEFGFPLGEHICPGNESQLAVLREALFATRWQDFQRRFLLEEHTARPSRRTGMR